MATFQDRYKKRGLLDAIIGIEEDDPQVDLNNTSDIESIQQALRPTNQQKRASFWDGLADIGRAMQEGRGLGAGVSDAGSRIQNTYQGVNEDALKKLQTNLTLKKLMKPDYKAPERSKVSRLINGKPHEGYQQFDPSTGAYSDIPDSFVEVKDPNAPKPLTAEDAALKRAMVDYYDRRGAAAAGGGGDIYHPPVMTSGGVKYWNGKTGQYEYAIDPRTNDREMPMGADLRLIADKEGAKMSGRGAGETAQSMPSINMVLDNATKIIDEITNPKNPAYAKSSNAVSSATGWGQSALNPKRYYASDLKVGEAKINQLKDTFKTLSAVDFSKAFKPMSNADVEAISNIATTLNSPGVPDADYQAALKEATRMIPIIRESFRAGSTPQYGGGQQGGKSRFQIEVVQ